MYLVYSDPSRPTFMKLETFFGAERLRERFSIFPQKLVLFKQQIQRALSKREEGFTFMEIYENDLIRLDISEFF